MPVFQYRCKTCQQEFEQTKPVSQSRQPSECSCGSEAIRILSPVGFLLNGDGWAGKDILVKEQMARKNAVLDVKQEEQRRYWRDAVKLAPNVNGERVEDWGEAKRLAASQGKDTATYDSLTQQKVG